jgi:hypothetical protein
MEEMAKTAVAMVGIANMRKTRPSEFAAEHQGIQRVKSGKFGLAVELNALPSPIIIGTSSEMLHRAQTFDDEHAVRRTVSDLRLPNAVGIEPYSEAEETPNRIMLKSPLSMLKGGSFLERSASVSHGKSTPLNKQELDQRDPWPLKGRLNVKSSPQVTGDFKTVSDSPKGKAILEE